MAQNQLPAAITMLEAQVPDFNRHLNYYALLAGLYQQNQQHDKAAETYLKLVKKNPQQSRWWLGLGISLEKMGKNVEAISAYKKARDLKLPARLMKYVDGRLQEMGATHAATQ
jgi:MSHA biogenesis protein MshN